MSVKLYNSFKGEFNACDNITIKFSLTWNKKRLVTWNSYAEHLKEMLHQNIIAANELIDLTLV